MTIWCVIFAQPLALSCSMILKNGGEAQQELAVAGSHGSSVVLGERWQPNHLIPSIPFIHAKKPLLSPCYNTASITEEASPK